MKPIQTKYKGFHFRSRLEARWAVFFDSLGVEWDYEKEGFELSTGERYLPDFWLPKDRIWVEVKGEQPTKGYRRMLGNFRSEGNSALLIVVGNPGNEVAELLAYDLNDSGGGEYDEFVDISAVSKGRLQLTSWEDSRLARDRVIFSDQWDTRIDVSYLPTGTRFPSVQKAEIAAKSARFEYGETPR